MKQWVVSIPIFGRATVFVEAETEEAALEAARDGEWAGHEIDEWEIAERCRGNVCNFSDWGFRAVEND